MARPLTALLLAALIGGASLAAPAVQAQTAPKAEANEDLADTLPDPPKGWTAGDTEAATGVLALYSGLTAQREYRKEDAKVTLAVARSHMLVQAIRGSIDKPVTMPPAATLENVAGRKAIVVRSSKPERLTVQIPIGTDRLVMLTAQGASLEDVRALAKDVDYDALDTRR